MLSANYSRLTMPQPSQRVVLIQEHLPHYRIRFFNLLRESLAAKGVELCLIHDRERASRVITEPLEWANPVRLGKIGPFVWHHLGNLCAGADLIIVPQEVKYLRCHLLYLQGLLGTSKFAYWGHGRNFQAEDPESWSEKFKFFLSKRVDWWFAYNELSAGIVRNLGFPADRITTVGNAIDTAALMQRRQEIGGGELICLREKIGLNSAHVAVYTGGLYPTKRIPFLLEAAKRIRERIPDFALLIIGDGPERPLVREAADAFPWIYDLGSRNDHDKVPYWALANVLLMPGGVGLVILDSFALGVPMVTTETHLHGPEISYLRDGKNGLIVPCGESAEPYAAAVADLLANPERLDLLRCGALSSAKEHSLETMVQNFSSGVLRALSPVSSPPTDS